MHSTECYFSSVFRQLFDRYFAADLGRIIAVPHRSVYMAGVMNSFERCLVVAEKVTKSDKRRNL